VQAAKLAQAPFLSSISFGAAKEMDSAGRAIKKLGGTPVTALLFKKQINQHNLLIKINRTGCEICLKIQNN